ncbi:hypothetical protein ILUMI_21138 [Ignelater luminosus]|uniref:Uncharacterized protein n=1 Tax=Ignelater luminosus TaxID=2038154 RepID=A0A8K0CJD8_IGNLU|nr:hypothetical protein ILUMI_21138 [Ignelater luminosus]
MRIRCERLPNIIHDGATVMRGHLNGLQKKVLEKYLKALLTHVINLVLQQSLECNTELETFFRRRNSLPSFFSHSPKRMQALSEFMSNRLPNLAATRWNFTSRLVHTVNNNKTALKQFFEHVS